MIKILFVCLGNICRSPAAEGVFRALVRERGLDEHIVVDSAGTSLMQVGRPPDPRTLAVARSRGLDLSALRARRIERVECSRHDYILTMDSANLEDVRALASPAHQDRIHRFLEFARHPSRLDVPDPYLTSGLAPFEAMFDLIEVGSSELLRRLVDIHPDALSGTRSIRGGAPVGDGQA